MKLSLKVLSVILLLTSLNSALGVFRDPPIADKSQRESKNSISKTTKKVKLGFHQRLAKYHRDEAARLQKKVQHHLKLAEYYDEKSAQAKAVK